jgi:predicted phage terminase large subunit-like protein
VRLHPAQQAFLQSDAVFRAFVGGIGSGKTWAGCYDLLKKAKPGRLYLVCAPTYTMLSDSTFRSFVTLAEELGIVDPLEVKRSAPPSIRLRTGAEILFRSGDEPDRLRGPNLSGVWLDEASLMSLDIFNVCIGRLREEGEQGWLSATFTPKGRSHWTYETFGSGSPDTALFHCRTRDNPFLPAAFHDRVRRQYTSAMAAQELEGEFIDLGGTMFQSHWFPLVDAVPPLVSRIRAWDLAATGTDEKARDPDFTAGVLMAKATDKTIYILDVQHLRGTPQEVQARVRATALRDGPEVAIVMEQEGGSSGKAIIDHFLRNVLSGFNFRGVRSTGNKVDRAQPLAAQAQGGAVRLLRGTWNREFLDEAELFPMGAHDDQIDAASMALSRLTSWTMPDFGDGPYVLTAGRQSSFQDGPWGFGLQEPAPFIHPDTGNRTGCPGDDYFPESSGYRPPFGPWVQ